MKEKLLVTVLENLEGELVKEYKEVNSIECLTELTESMLEVLTMSVRSEIEKIFDKRLEFEKMLNEIDGIKVYAVEGNRFHIEVADCYVTTFDLFPNTEVFDGQKFTGKVTRKIFEIDNKFKIKINKGYKDGILMIELLNDIDFIEFGLPASNFKEYHNLSTKKYKGINYHKLNNDYSGIYYMIEVENDNVFTPTLNKLIKFNLKNNNITLKTEKQVKEYINFILDDINQIYDIIDVMNVDYISYKIQKELSRIEGNFEDIIKEGFKKGLITGIKKIQYIKPEYPLSKIIRATIYIDDHERKIRVQEYIDGGKVVNVAKLV